MNQIEIDKYVFKRYENIFPILFKKEKTRIAKHIGKKLLIEHIGSTAVLGLGGKGIIDILVVASKKEIANISKQIIKAGYDFRPKGGFGDRLFFRIDLPDEIDGQRRYHLHLIPLKSEQWKGDIAFRNYLSENKEALREYEEVKKRAVKNAKGDQGKYKRFKEKFYKKITKIINP